jgi:hypothetical protein
MHFMSNAVSLPPGAARKRGQNLTVERQQVIIGKLMDKMIEGYHSTSELARETGVSRPTVDRYRPIVDELIGKTRIDRNAIRALQIRRTYTIIEQLMNDLKHASGYKERAAYYSQIYKFSSHLALITGLNVETQVHVDAKKLVVIRSNESSKVQNERDDVSEAEIIDQN